MKLVIGGGGTAGHVYPGLALLEQWPEPGPEACWFGRAGGMEEALLGEAGVAFIGLRAGPIRGKGPIQVLANTARLAVGVLQAWRHMRRLAPDVVLTTGGFVSVPVAIGAKLARVPLVVFLPDVRPGLAVRAQVRIADRLAYAFEPPEGPGPHVVTGYPVRSRFGHLRAASARADLGLEDALPVVLVYGGSLGARAINNAVVAELAGLLARAQVIHVSGAADYDRLVQVRAHLEPVHQGRYHLHPYLGASLADAMAAADLCVARAGASTLAELPAVGLPAILVPGPFSDQAANAAYLADSGAALCLSQERLDQGGLSAVITELLDDPGTLEAMARASKALARPQAAQALRAELEGVAKNRRGRSRSRAKDSP
ncbi:MAG: UDP-N-acetylglucosamine--N-acetylmuramyl-(pentapeptide) pyrophosphoryl-undecaprenol N-acetylglucosamine transferase [Acidimicrobiales bacterium]